MQEPEHESTDIQHHNPDEGRVDVTTNINEKILDEEQNHWEMVCSVEEISQQDRPPVVGVDSKVDWYERAPIKFLEEGVA